MEAWGAAGMWCQKFDPVVRIGRGGGHISEGIQLGGEVMIELVANLHIVSVFSVLFGKVLVIVCACASGG